jgi:uncharacterized protein (DUF433 family)
MEWRKRIRTDPQVCHGKACVKGTRIMASVVLDNLAAGRSPDEIVKLYPTLHRDDVAAVLAYCRVGQRARGADQRGVKFKLDENLSPSLAVLFAAAAHDAHSVVQQALGGQPDERVLDVCVREKRALVTLDLGLCQYPCVSSRQVLRHLRSSFTKPKRTPR